ncbi:MAG: FKBP-type peptidyl-prolyl cis-trans isomerase, partial [Caldimicrobium sp.]
MKITKDTFVRLRYCMEIEGEKTPEWFSKPIEVSFVFGREAIPTIIERAIENKEENERVEVTIPPQSAYGPHLNYLV